MLTIYGVPVSVHTRKTIAAAAAKKLDFHVEPVIPFDPPENWAALSPTGKIPVMDHDGYRLADSSVICTYLERAFPETPLYPADTKELMQALWLEEYCDGTLFRDVVHGLFYQKVIRPNMLGEETDDAEIARIEREAIPPTFGYLESQLNGAFAAGRALSIADIAIASNMMNYQYLNFAIDEYLYPSLATFTRRTLKLPVFQAIIAEEKPVAESMGLATGYLGEIAA